MISLILTIHYVLDITINLRVCFQDLLVVIDRARMNVPFIFDTVYAERQDESEVVSFSKHKMIFSQ